VKGRGSPSCLEELVARWREAAAELNDAEGRPYSAGSETASVLAVVADELEEAIQGDPLVEVTVPEAAAETGYSEWHLRELIRRATVPARRDGKCWLIQRRHLPQRPGTPRRYSRG
jgi:hypothetical protein